MSEPLIWPVVQQVGQIFAFELALKQVAIGPELRRNMGNCELRPIDEIENIAGTGG
jgi:hypothetical protein